MNVDGSLSTAYAEPYKFIGETSKLTITVKNEYGLLMRHLVRDDFVITGLRDAVLDNFQNLGNGKYSFDITDHTVETIVLTIIVDGVEIDNHPQIHFEIFAYQILFQENFTNISQGNLPTGWGYNTSGWYVNTSNNAGGTSPELRFDWITGTNGTNRVNTDFIDASSANNLQLSFKHYVNHFTSSYTLSVQTQIEGSSTWVTQWSETISSNVSPQTLSVDFSSLDGEKFKIAWVFDGEVWKIDYWHIDDIVLEHF